MGLMFNISVIQDGPVVVYSSPRDGLYLASRTGIKIDDCEPNSRVCD